MSYKIAIASSDGKLVNQHFGRCPVFHIIEADSLGKIHFIESRSQKPVCEGQEHDERRLEEAAEMLQDCDYVLVGRIGSRAHQVLAEHGVEAFEIPGIITESVKELIAYIEIQNLLN